VYNARVEWILRFSTSVFHANARFFTAELIRVYAFTSRVDGQY